MQQIILRNASLEDSEAIVKIYLESRKKFLPFAPLAHNDKQICNWICNTVIPQHQVIVAQKNGTTVGMMVLLKNKEIGWIDQLYISPDCIRQGIGTMLVEKAKDILKSPIRLRTFQQNTTARTFYEKQGFQALESSDGSANEEHCPDILYEWKS